jgi:large exoprotein involved in heme utilization and adhesion
VFSFSESGHNAGTVSVSAPTVTVDSGGIISQAFDRDAGASIDVQAARLALKNGSQISAKSFGAAPGGGVQVTATESLEITGIDANGFPSALVTRAESSGDAGPLRVSAPTILLDGGLVAETSGAGAAGSLDVQARRLEMRPGSQISGSTFGPGRGATVRVTASESMAIEDAVVVSNTFGDGAAGSVDVRAGRLTLLSGAQIGSSSTRTVSAVQPARCG